MTRAVISKLLTLGGKDVETAKQIVSQMWKLAGYTPQQMNEIVFSLPIEDRILFYEEAKPVIASAKSRIRTTIKNEDFRGTVMSVFNEELSHAFGDLYRPN